MPRTRRAAATVEPEAIEEDAFEELEDDDAAEDDDELEELEEAPAKRPAKKTAAKKVAPKAAAETDPHNSAWLVSYINEETGQSIDTRGLRMLLRKMAKDGDLAREVGTDRNRYTFPKGANDPTVKLVLRKVKAGELTAAKREGLDKVKKAAPVKTAKGDAPAAKATRGAAKDAPAKATASRRRRPAAE